MGVSPILQEAFMSTELGPAPSADAWARAWPQSHGEFERLVEAYQHPLVQYAFRRLGNIHDAEDAVQEVFIRSYARRAECAHVSPVGPYLYRMAANACTDMLRKRRRTETHRDVNGIQDFANGQDNASTLCAAEELRRAEDLLRRLPKKQAEAVRLRTFDGLRLNEIAEVIGCSPNTVSSRLRYGFKRLRKIVSKEWQR